MIYLDNAATTPLSQTVITEMTDLMSNSFGNPSSTHTFGRQAKQLLRNYRDELAHLLETQANKIIFTSGGTEANNTAIKGYALANQDKGKHLITTAIEHHSVLHVMDYLQKRFGFEVTYLYPIDGTISPDQVKEALRPDTILVSMMYANNETGQLLPIKKVGEILKEHQAAFHVDAVQVAGKLPLSPEILGIDFLSLSAHKFHGPKGIGLLYASKHVDALLHGGDQEDKRRAGTENLIGVAGMTRALSENLSHADENSRYISRLKTHFLTSLDIPYYLNGEGECLPHLINIGFPGADNGSLLTKLDLSGFAVSTGSACTAGTVTPSHVLGSLFGQNSPRLRESIRISLSEQNTPEELEQLAHTLNQWIGE